jgi:hypothetical protein
MMCARQVGVEQAVVLVGGVDDEEEKEDLGKTKVDER